MTAAPSIKLDEATRDRLRDLAKASNRTPDAILREAVAQYLEREERRLALRAETLAALEEFTSSGLHLTAAEVDRWLESWGSDKETLAPACHG